jgi:O-succinylbenzoic acid--CoA ligase
MTPAPRLLPHGGDPAEAIARLDEVLSSGDAALVGSMHEAVRHDPRRPLLPDVELPADTALVIPTSGSTGAPRAVVLSHAALAASTAASLAALGCESGERWALALPLQHIAGLQVLARSRALGTSPVIVDQPGDPVAIAAAAEHAQHIALVPTQVSRCLDAGVDLRPFRTVLVGGAPLDPSRADEARTAGVRLVQSYGMTETCGGCVYDGRPLEGVEVRIDDAGLIGGIIRLRGPMLATGYLDASDADAARFTADGWFVTDDLGRIGTDPEGRTLLEVLGRADDVINTGGVKVAPRAVERIVRTLPGVADVLILGVPDPEWGERVRAIVVPVDEDAPPTLRTIREALATLLPVTHAPSELALADRIQRDELGKVTAAERARLAGLDALSPD